jgi:small subunit ribosomal protein S13
MASNIRIAGANIPGNKHCCIALTSIFGIGRSCAVKICKKACIDPAKILSHCTEQEIESIRTCIRDIPHAMNLRKKIVANIERLMRIKSYVGKRHKFGLPVHGQRTRSNGSTARKRNASIRTNTLNG